MMSNHQSYYSTQKADTSSEGKISRMLGKEADDEIDIGEVLSMLRAHAAVIIVSMGLLGGLAAFYAYRLAEPTYAATAIFKIQDTQSNSLSSSEIGGAGSLLGLSLPNENLSDVFDRAAGRDFVVNLAEEVGLDEDPMFAPPAEEPSVLAAVLSYMRDPDRENDNIIDTSDARQTLQNAIYSNYKKLVLIDKTESGSVTVTVTHQQPKRAAEIANAIVQKLATDIAADKEAAQDRTLEYMSARLGDALLDVARTEKAAQNFAVENNISSREEFLSRSVQLLEAREARDEANRRIAALQEIEKIYSSGATYEGSMNALRAEHPIVDSEQFRISLGIPAAINQWTWPTRERVITLRNVEQDRLARLELRISGLQKEADDLAQSSADLQSLEREAAVAQATYEVLIEQVKAKSLEAGFESQTAKIYQTAVAPVSPSAPRKSLFVAAGALLGFLAGSAIALIRGVRSGKFYTRRRAFEVSQPSLALVSKSLKRLQGRWVERLQRQADSLDAPELTELSVYLSSARPKWIVCASLGTRQMALGPAIWLAQSLDRGEEQCAFVDLSSQVMWNSSKNKVTTLGDLEQAVEISGLSIFRRRKELSLGELLSRPRAIRNFKDAMQSYEHVFMVVPEIYLAAAHRAFASDSPSTVLFSAPKHASRDTLVRLRAVTPITALVMA